MNDEINRDIQRLKNLITSIEGMRVEDKVIIMNTFIHSFPEYRKFWILSSNAMFMWAQRNVEYWHTEVNDVYKNRLKNIRNSIMIENPKWRSPNEV